MSVDIPKCLTYMCLHACLLECSGLGTTGNTGVLSICPTLSDFATSH